ncbi:anthranilate synthase component I family protein [Flavobacteriaceae bacterium F89]|uniref:Anthranilate synthase component I family protein n=1 Tax=Cerina litoralis TaxID=2874477 RepID=A0AAE3EYN1_9FLAO|nr:anthranilate synthase component I family protein [Cerina litoralis]MCG2462910.1 anthranilate synthase component I family protein [Cerina litoralis]
MRTKSSFKLPSIPSFKESLLQWGQQFGEVMWLDGNGHKDPYSSFDALLAVEAHTSLRVDDQNGFEELTKYQNEVGDWIFGYLSYDLKNEIEQLESHNYDGLDFPKLYFFRPKKIIRIIGDRVHFLYMKELKDEIEPDFRAISAFPVGRQTNTSSINIKMRIFKDAYYNKVDQLLAHIHRGDVYEANFCQEFYAEDVVIDPAATYGRLNSISRPPFATFFRSGEMYLLSASPERYLKKEGSKVISQPIKGTARRAAGTSEDTHLKMALACDKKERAENIMIVDLVRNDLSKGAIRGSVGVAELCQVYSYAQVHQMISTVTARVLPSKNPVEIIVETFPMGSMTGAPKVSAMKIIETLEATKRGLYSGAMGYFDPNGNFDFSVVIRSILYNADKKYVSYSVGSAITARSVPEREYEECLLKARAMREVLEGGKGG